VVKTSTNGKEVSNASFNHRFYFGGRDYRCGAAQMNIWDGSPRFCDAYNDSETKIVFDKIGSLGIVKPYYTACAWRRVETPDGKVIANVNRRADQAFIAELLLNAREVQS
jgi:hypothetical protein